MSRRGGTASNEKYQAWQAQQLGLAQRQRDADLLELMRLPAGRRFMRHLVLELGGLEQLTFNLAGALSSRGEGRRSVAREVKDELERLCPDLWHQAEAEALKARASQQSNQQAAEAAAQGEDDDG